MNTQTNTGPMPHIAISTNGYNQFSVPASFVVRNVGFSGVFNLDTPFGTFWNDYVQTGVLNLSVSGRARVGCTDRVKITANGSAINVPAEFTNVGTDAISTVNGTTNTIYVVKTGDNSYDYVVKVI
jgi:hypothetical protein